MTDFWKTISRKSANNTQWEVDLKDWLKNCKKITSVTDETFKQWDKHLTGNAAPEDIESFCKHTGWHVGKP